MSKRLEQSAKRSMRKMAELNYDENVQRMTDYYIVVDQGKVGELTPISKAINDVKKKKAAGQLDRLNQPIKMPYEVDPQIVSIQKEIERIAS